MRVIATKLTDVSLLRRACEMTMHDRISKVSLVDMYRCEHSPMRTQIFWIELHSIPTFVSTHMRTHSVGVTHFVQSNRDDSPGASINAHRWTPVNHGLLANAQALVNISRKRLCRKSHPETIRIWRMVCSAIHTCDTDLARFMVPDCEYRGQCYELTPCNCREAR